MAQGTQPGERIAIIGSGGIGGYLAGQLQRAGHDVTLCVRTPFERLVIVEKDGEENVVPVRIATDPADEQPAKWILVTTKAQDVASTAGWLKQLSGPGSITVMVQNGIDHEARARPFLPEGAVVLPSIIHCAVERTEPGRIVHHGAAKITVPDNPEAAAFAALFENTRFQVLLDPDFITAAWSKLLSNAMANPLTALTLRRLAVFEDPAMAALAQSVGQEVVAVGRALGAKLDENAIRTVLADLASNPLSGSSMLYDRLSERPLEYAYITGAVVSAAEAAEIDVPVNRTILALLSGASGHPLNGRE